MTPALTAAAERLITLPGFRWMPGMRDTEGRRFVGDTETAEPLSIFVEWLVDVARGGERAPRALPDLTDPATIGCVLAMVREALNDPSLYLDCYADQPPSQTLRWAVKSGKFRDVPGNYSYRSTPGEALADALTEGAK
jgi:hypothetical protein